MLVLQPMVVPHAPLHHANISASSTQVVSEVLSKMLMVGITDPGRLWIFFFFFFEVPRVLFCCFSTVILAALHNCADINCFEMIDLLVLMLFLAVSCIIMML